MPETERMLLGKLGEVLGALFLEKEGYRILFKNFRCAEGEIDLIAADRGDLVFVEVRTRQNDEFGHPLESVGHKKQMSLRRSAARFLADHPMSADNIRFDVLSILLKEGNPGEFELVKNAICPDYSKV